MKLAESNGGKGRKCDGGDRNMALRKRVAFRPLEWKAYVAWQFQVQPYCKNDFYCVKNLYAQIYK